MTRIESSTKAIPIDGKKDGEGVTLPPEIFSQIMDECGGSIGAEEAKEIRLELMKERGQG